MTKSTDDDAAQIGGEHVETMKLTPEHDAYPTQKLSDPSQQPQATAPPDPFGSTATIGDYRIIRKIGEGGMGVVYEAEQQHPRRLVALKVIRAGLHADDYHVKMFEREIQALARLKHPGIASIYESGRAEDGQIFFAMELVRGTTLTEFVEDAKISGTEQMADVDTQLELFSKICDVVSYAHQRGVIHRDLKPQNILVTDETDESGATDSAAGKVGVKILDFGLARITDPDIAGGASDLSQIGQIKGTLLYMSPEQVRGRPDDIDVRSDVYALGVMLYEMLTGQMPYDITQVSLPEAIRIICEEPPKMPSKVWSMGTKRSARIDHDVETIVLKALEKEPDRRYQSVSALMDDIQRYLTNQPILARPPSPYYQFRKLVARHKAAFASMATIFLLLLGFGVVMAAQSVRIANERDKAVKAEQTAEERKTEAEQSRNEAVLARNDEQKQRLIAEENLTRAESEQKRAEEEKTKAEKAQIAEEEQRKIAETNLIDARNQKAVADKQTTIAQQQKTIAEQNAKEANEQEIIAGNQAERNRQFLYVSQMRLAEQSLQQGNISQLDEVLESQKPKQGEPDRRGFEWYYLWRIAHRDSRTLTQADHILASKFLSDGTLLVNLLKTDPASVPPKSSFEIAILDVSTGQTIKTFPNLYVSGLFDAGENIAVGESDALFNSKPGKPAVFHILNTKIRQVRPTKIPMSLFSHAAVSPDGKSLAIAEIEAVEIWDVESGVMKRSIRSGSKQFSSTARWLAFQVGFSPDGKMLAVSGASNQPSSKPFSGTGFTLWDVGTGRELASQINDGLDFYSLAFSRDSTYLATGGLNGAVKLYNIDSNKLITGLFGGETDFSALTTPAKVEFSPDGNLLGVTNGREVKLYDVNRKKAVSSVRGHTTVTSSTFSLDGNLLATTGDDQKIKLWKLPFADEVTVLPFTGPDLSSLDGIPALALSPDGRELICDNKENGVYLCDLSANEKTKVLEAEEIQTTNLLVPPVLKTYPAIPKEKAGFRKPRFSNRGTFLALVRLTSEGPSSTVFEIWDVRRRERVFATVEQISLYAFSDDDNLLATVSVDGKARLWDIRGQKVISTFQTEPAFTPGKSRPVMALSPNGKMLAVRGDLGFKLIDMKNGQDLYGPFITDGSERELKFSRDSKFLNWAARSEGITVVNTADGKVSKLRNESVDPGVSYALSPDGRVLGITASDNKDIELFDVGTERIIGILKGHIKMVSILVFSPDSKRLASLGLDGTVKIWDVAAQQALLSLNSGFGSEIIFSPDGRSLIMNTISDSVVVKVWRGATDEEIQKQRGH